MDIFQAIIIGIIEGFTEFLPISSTGHMIVASKLMGIDQDNIQKSFEVIIQFAAILAVVLLYRDKVFKDFELWKKLILAFIPIGAVGFIFSKQIKALFSVEIVAWMFIIGGIIFLIVEYFYKEKDHYVKRVEDVSYKQALAIGAAQCFSLIPGTSRAGSTIIGGMLVHLTRKAAAEFSFLLAIPVMTAVTGYDIVKHYHEFSFDNWIVLAVGFVTAFVVAYITIKLFIEFLSRFTFVPFGIYRILFGIFLLWYF
ncbi:MAG: undecaprenyl-diphosphate phosphatase [Epsilonproteobacteria bacterium]|nr:undecaprenyl-diphosphate phosphatase [Campylobacterota bacterium]